MAIMIRNSGVANVVAGFVLGYIVYRQWRPRAALWVWLPGLVWFASRASEFWFAQPDLHVLHVQRHSVWLEMSGLGCNNNVESCWDWLAYTMVLLRTVSYSSAAAWCAYRGKYGWDDWAARLRSWRGGAPLDRGDIID
jgi:hypothetical protein